MDFPFVKEAISQLFSKTSCAMYPAVPSEAAPNYRGRIVYHADKCIGCGMCERVCAGSAITRTVEKLEEGDRITLTFNLGSCTFCATCADFCSTKAIEFTGDYQPRRRRPFSSPAVTSAPRGSLPRPSPPPRPRVPQALLLRRAPSPPETTASPSATRLNASTAPSAPESARRARLRSIAPQRRGSAAMTTVSPAAPAPRPARKRPSSCNISVKLYALNMRSGRNFACLC